MSKAKTANTIKECGLLTREERAKFAEDLRRIASEVASALERLELPDRKELVLIEQLRQRRQERASRQRKKKRKLHRQQQGRHPKKE